MDISQQYGQQNFTLPHDVVKLPSGGVFYKNKKKAVKVGYLTASDENILMGGDGINKDGIVFTLLRSKIYEPDIRPEELTQGDLEAILIFLRNTAFGPDYTLTPTDPVTKEPFETIIRLDELNIKTANEMPSEDGTFTTKLPKSELTVKIKPLTFGELTELDRLAKSYPPGRLAPTETWKLAKMVVEIDGNSDAGHIMQTVETLPIADSKYIKNYINDNEPRLDLVRRVIAPSGKEVYVNIAFGVEFFRPFF